MTRNFLLLLIATSTVFFSCQKETISESEIMVSSRSANTNNNFENDVPFKAYYITRAEFLQGPAVQRITGTGDASHLGESMFVANATVNFSTAPPFAIAGTAVFTAANGDQFYTQFTGTSTPTGIGTSRGDFYHTIIGGTGRFEDATGSFTGIAIVNAASPTNTVTFEGTINY